ncbi:MAG: AEC family transporter [Lachnospiraceae bacterium]|nr:AEC family transporter [Lachnospiraceae bacterium]
MNTFLVTLSCVAVMLVYAVPGFILVKTGKVKQDAIKSFANVLMYVCSPCLTIYSFRNVTYSVALVKDIAVLFVISILFQAAIMLLFAFLFRKKFEDVKIRVCVIATALGNCAFMGVPLLEAVMPHYPQAIMMSSIFSIGMNLLGWTLASAIIMKDRKYVSIRKALINPVTITLLVAVPIFVFGIELPEQVDGMITLVGRMSTPMCMLVMGMRLATVELKKLFTDKDVYATVLVKQIIVPLAGLLILLPLPLGKDFQTTLFILYATPVASIVLNFPEMLGKGQKEAANLVLLGTLLSIVTIPLLMLIYSMLGV